MSRVRTSGKGAVVIPKEIRLAVGLAPGQYVEVAAEGTSRIVIRPLALDPVQALEGLLRARPGGSVADFVEERRREDRARRKPRA